MPDLGSAVETTLKRWLGVRGGEEVVVIADPVHVAFGDSSGLGGAVSVPIHLDVVVCGATLAIDGRPVLDAGRFVLDA